MPKDTEKNRYFDVAVPRLNTLLLDLLKEIHTHTNIPESQLLVQFATEYAKQIRGQPASFAAMGQILPAVASVFSARFRLLLKLPGYCWLSVAWRYIRMRMFQLHRRAYPCGYHPLRRQVEVCRAFDMSES